MAKRLSVRGKILYKFIANNREKPCDQR